MWLTTNQEAVKTKKELASGFGDKGQGYSVSKACVNAITAVLARENQDLTINACCPGWVDTDMGGIMGKPPKEPSKFRLVLFEWGVDVLTKI